MFSGAIKEALSRFFKIDELTDHVSGYVEARVALLKVEIREEVAKAMTRIMVMGVVVLFTVLVLVFISIGIALFINQYFNKSYVGFLMVGGLYLILVLLSYAFRKQILTAIENSLNEQLRNQKN